MTIRALTTGYAPDDVIALDYLVDGERTAAAIVRGDSRLTGVALAALPDKTLMIDNNFRTTLQKIGELPRVYDDAIFARTVERVYKLPAVRHFHDVHVMKRLLETAGQDDSHKLPDMQHDSSARAPWIIRQFQTLPVQLAHVGLDVVYANVELPVIDVVVDMTVNGVPVDTSVLAQTEASVTARRDILRRQLAEEFAIINPDDDDQIREFLYDHLHLTVPFRTRKGQRSVCNAALRQLEALSPVIPLVRDYRSHRQSLATCQSLIRNHCPLTGSVHGHLDPLGTSTGRFNCKEPNLHGISQSVRRAIHARPGYSLVEADMSQAEFRVLAHFTRDADLVEAFAADDVDLHKQTMAIVLGKAVEGVTSEERKVGKAVNFGIVFGETEHGLSRQLGISPAEAREYIDGFFCGRPAIYRWVETVKQQVRRDGSVRTLFGRQRSLPTIRSRNPVDVAAAERKAVNTIIQGTAADLMKIILARLRYSLPDGCQILMTVHDSVLLEVPIDHVPQVSRIVKRTMEAPMPEFSIPMRVEVHAGADWGNL